MSGIQITGLASGLNWQNIINELVTADSAGQTQVKTQQTKVNNQVTALASLSSDMTNLESSVFSLEDPSLFGNVTATSTTPGSAWAVSASTGTAPGSYTIAVGQPATPTTLQGAGRVSGGLSSTDDVTGVTVATAATAVPITAGSFTVDGQQIPVTTTESLQDVFTAISTATGGTVTAGYDSGTDKVTLTSTAGTLVLGAANDTSNFLQALQLGGNGLASSTSAGRLGTLVPANPLSSANLGTALTGQDSSGNGSFTVNGVSIAYNVDTDSLSTVINRINTSGAAVTASYDSSDNQMVLTNNVTGNLGISASDTSGNLLAALGLTSASGATMANGQNATFTVNGGALKTSSSNNLTAAQLGVPGLNVTVTGAGTQTIAVASDTTAIQSAIQSFVSNFNTLQADIGSDTVVSEDSSGNPTTSILSNDNEVGDWASSLETTAFEAGDSVTGGISSLDALGIDFSGTSRQLSITDSAKLSQALSGNPSGVAAFFQTARTGFGSLMNNALSEAIGEDSSDSANLQSESNDLGNQISTMQQQLDAEQQNLETEFSAMETMESQFQSESAALNAIGGGSSSSSSSGSGTSINNSEVAFNGVSNATTGSSG